MTQPSVRSEQRRGRREGVIGGTSGQYKHMNCIDGIVQIFVSEGTEHISQMLYFVIARVEEFCNEMPL